MSCTKQVPYSILACDGNILPFTKSKYQVQRGLNFYVIQLCARKEHLAQKPQLVLSMTVNITKTYIRFYLCFSFSIQCICIELSLCFNIENIACFKQFCRASTKFLSLLKVTNAADIIDISHYL